MFTEERHAVYITFKEKENLVFSNDAVSVVQASPSFVEVKVKSIKNEDEFITYWFPVSDIQEVKIITKIVDVRG